MSVKLEKKKLNLDACSVHSTLPSTYICQDEGHQNSETLVAVWEAGWLSQTGGASFTPAPTHSPPRPSMGGAFFHPGQAT